MVPKYKCFDSITFKLEGTEIEGTIAVVDKYGTFECPDQVCYDIVGDWEGKETLFKHVRESMIQ